MAEGPEPGFPANRAAWLVVDVLQVRPAAEPQAEDSWQWGNSAPPRRSSRMGIFRYSVSMFISKEHSTVGAWAQYGRSARETPMNAQRGCSLSCGDPGTMLLCTVQFSSLFMGFCCCQVLG